MPDHVAESARPTANGVITLMAAIGGAVALLVIAPTFDRASWLPFALAAGLALSTLIVLVVAAQRHPPHVSTGTIQDDAPLVGALLRDLRSLTQRSQRRALWLLAGLFACFFGFAAVEAQFSVLATETLGVSGGDAGRMLGFASGAFVLAALPAGAVARRLGSLPTMCVGAAVLALALLTAFVRFDPTVLAVAMAIAGAGWAAVLVPAYPRVVGLGGRDRIGFYTGMYYLFGSGAAIVAPALVGGAMDVFGNTALLLASALALSLGIALLWASGRRGVEAAGR